MGLIKKNPELKYITSSGENKPFFHVYTDNDIREI